MIRDVNLISYLPQFVQEYKEIKSIMSAENPEFQLIANESEVIKDNQFILTCNENGIKRFEQLLEIIPNLDDTLEARISRVLTRWNDSIPYTYRGLIEKLNSLCGEGNYQIMPKFDSYEMELIVFLPLSGQVSELEYLLYNMIPANTKVSSMNLIPYEATGTIYAASTSIESKIFQITSELNTEYVAEGKFLNGSTITKVIEYTIN